MFPCPGAAAEKYLEAKSRTKYLFLLTNAIKLKIFSFNALVMDQDVLRGSFCDIYLGKEYQLKSLELVQIKKVQLLFDVKHKSFFFFICKLLKHVLIHKYNKISRIR